MEERKKLTLDELRETSEFQQLTLKQQLFVATYVETGMSTGKYDPIAAVQQAYVCKNPESARVMSYAMMGNIRIVQVLNRHFNAEPIEDFIKQIDRAIRNRKLSIAQIEALKLKAGLLGFDARLPGAGHQRPGKAVEDAATAARAARKSQRKPSTKKPAAEPPKDTTYGF